MRFAWYAGVSTALAAGVVVSAFHQRANFYSAMVYLFQSNMCLMILVNLTLLVYSSFVYGLQRVCFGQLRAVEVEQLYERAWFAVTETCLAMTIFRDELGGFFMVMFVALLTGKVWGWIGEGRIEALEQQPPANPRLFHMRLSISLLLSFAYDMAMFRYAVKVVSRYLQANMMVMFLFEFAVLSVTSFHSSMRYIIVLLDTAIVKKQTKVRLEARRREVREEREAILRRRADGEPDDGEPLPDEEDVDEMDIEVPGWEAKGQYILALDLWTDFVKLCLYAVFFFVLMTYVGMPLHIIRDLFMTVRSFVKRLGALMKYRQAMREVNKYADATEEDLARENTCIICREDMHVWNPADLTTVERSRPKKLPCGHILHLGCLKSWMERQQVCPTCRRSVVVSEAAQQRNDAVMLRLGLNLPGGAGGGGGAGAAAGAAGAGAEANPAAPNAGAPGGGEAANGGPHPIGGGGGGAIRMFNFGPLRFGFAQGGIQDIQQMAQRMGIPPAMAAGNGGAGGAVPDAPPPQQQPAGDGQAAEAALGTPGVNPAPPPGYVAHGDTFPASLFFSPSPSIAPEAILADLRAIEQRIEMATNAMQNATAETQHIRQMLEELHRIRQTQAQPAGSATPSPEQGLSPQADGAASPAPVTIELETNAATPAIPAGSANLPAGVQIPAGWSLIPLQAVSDDTRANAPSTTEQTVSPPSDVATGQPNGKAVESSPCENEAADVPESSAAESAPRAAPPVWGSSTPLFRSAADGSSSESRRAQVADDSDTDSS